MESEKMDSDFVAAFLLQLVGFIDYRRSLCRLISVGNILLHHHLIYCIILVLVSGFFAII